MLTLKRDAERYCNFNWCASRVKILSLWVVLKRRVSVRHGNLGGPRWFDGEHSNPAPLEVAGMPGQPDRRGRRRSPFVQRITRHRAP